MRLMMAEPNVLLLDEPTNDLDIDTLTALEDLLDGWPGTLVVVSHDRYFVERVCDDVYAITDDGGLAHMPGGIEQYLELRARQLEERIAPPRRAGGRRSEGRARCARRAGRPCGSSASSRGSTHARPSCIELLAEHATSYERVAALDAELRELTSERARVEDAWLAAAELLEA